MDLDALCENESWATVRCEPTLDRQGRDVAVVVAKLAYYVDVVGNATVTFRPVRFGVAMDGFGGVQFPAELVDEKPGTDVGLVGVAYPPKGKPAQKMLAWVQAGTLRKVVTVHGVRRYIADFTGIVPGNAALLEEAVPLRFDHCYGGHDHASHTSDPFNPLGRGFAADPKTLVGKLVAPLEPVDDPLRGKTRDAARSNRSHGCFAPIPETFEPRRSLVGTHDSEWARKRAPIRPKDFDVAHNSWSMPELRSVAPLSSDTPFEIAGATAEGIWRFKLPAYEMEFESTLLGDKRPHPTHLDSILIDAEEHVVELTFRASILLPRKWAMLERISARGVGVMPKEALETNDKQLKKPGARSEASTGPTTEGRSPSI